MPTKPSGGVRAVDSAEESQVCREVTRDETSVPAQLAMFRFADPYIREAAFPAKRLAVFVLAYGMVITIRDHEVLAVHLHVVKGAVTSPVCVSVSPSKKANPAFLSNTVPSGMM